MVEVSAQGILPCSKNKLELKMITIWSCDSNNGQKCNSRNISSVVTLNVQIYGEWIVWCWDS